MTSSGCAIHDIPTHPAAIAPSKRLCTEASTNALIYEWTLDGVDPEHPLFGTPYFGQVVRRGFTHEEMFEVRKQEHVSDARRDPKETGLHWAIRVFGVNSFTVRIVETTRLPRVQAMEWANEREAALIDENGGVMRDCEPRKPIRQTFNLTSGGQGDPHKNWEGVQATSRKKLMRVWPKFKAYYEEHKNLRVPLSHPELGSIVRHIRLRHDFLAHEDFKKWLDERNFVYDAYRDHLEKDVWPKFEAYYQEHTHLRVPLRYPELGMIVKSIRSQNSFLQYDDFKKWLNERNFVYDARRAHLEEDVWPKFKAYYEEHKHLRVPRSYPKLGKLVNRIRSSKDFLQYDDFRSWLWDHGFKMHARDAVKNAAKWAEVNGTLHTCE